MGKNGKFPNIIMSGRTTTLSWTNSLVLGGDKREVYTKVEKVLTSMRRTTQYFEGKLKLLHKTNTMEWYDGQLRHEANREAGIETTFRKARNYFQYNSKHDIDRKMMLGEVI